VLAFGSGYFFLTGTVNPEQLAFVALFSGVIFIINKWGLIINLVEFSTPKTSGDIKLRAKIFGLQILNLIGQRFDIWLGLTIVSGAALRDISILKVFSTAVLFFSSSLSYNFLAAFARQRGHLSLPQKRLLVEFTILFFVLYQVGIFALIKIYNPTIDLARFLFYLQMHAIIILIIPINTILTSKRKFDFLALRIIVQAVLLSLLGSIYGFNLEFILIIYPIVHLVSYALMLIFFILLRTPNEKTVKDNEDFRF
jgi:hypothetical protein